ncbi:hypothetical protein [Alicyclobacillus macrosporangiidus]|uniref:hypothetical protein n=1 Tax=Alicyclobacillus macrosporangiidus TaxID=392015 RepID=UPI000497C204|nr:hypothetical protein [Alicyclobacillus macrosporangiidus]
MYEAKRELKYLGISVHIPELMATLEPEQEEAVQQSMPYLVVIDGGKPTANPTANPKRGIR